MTSRVSPFDAPVQLWKQATLGFKCFIQSNITKVMDFVKSHRSFALFANWCQRNLLPTPLSSERYLLACLLSMSTVFSSGHGNEEDWLSCVSRKCCEDNRMCTGSAVEGRRIQGSYCTLWNGLRNARCLPCVSFIFFRSESYHMLEATGFEDNVTLCDTCVTSCWHTDVCGHPPPHSPVTARRLHQWEKKPSISSCSSGVWSRQRCTVDRNCHLKIYQTNVQLITSVECGYQQKQGLIQWAFTIWWMQISW